MMHSVDGTIAQMLGSGLQKSCGRGDHRQGVEAAKENGALNSSGVPANFWRATLKVLDTD